MAAPLAGKVALVTASSAGLGAAVAQTLAAAGASVVINYYTHEARANELIQELKRISETRSAGARFAAVRADMGDRAGVYTLVDTAVQIMKRLDIVVSNQGWTRFTDFKDLDANMNEDDWDRCYQVNVKSHLWLFHAARPRLEESSGAFVSVASTTGVTPSGSSLAYSVSKAALIHLIKGLATIAGERIRVNSVSPGIMLTEWGRQFPPEKLEAAIRKSTLQRLATVEDVAEQILFFASARCVTGINIVIDAGWSLSRTIVDAGDSSRP